MGRESDSDSRPMLLGPWRVVLVWLVSLAQSVTGTDAEEASAFLNSRRRCNRLGTTQNMPDFSAAASGASSRNSVAAQGDQRAPVVQATTVGLGPSEASWSA